MLVPLPRLSKLETERSRLKMACKRSIGVISRGDAAGAFSAASGSSGSVVPPRHLSLWRQCHAPNQSPDVTSRDDAGGVFGGLASSPRSLQKLTGRHHAQAGKTEMR